MQTDLAPDPDGNEQPKSFDEELIKMIPALRAFARSLCGSRDVADDLTQETLAKAWKYRSRFRFGTNLKAWLFVILRNEFYSMHRRAKTAADYSSTMGNNTDHADAEQESRLDLTDLMRAFGQLAPEQKEALMLTANGFSYEEVARICECAVGTIKSRVSRARQQLQKLVDGHGGPIGARGESSDYLNKILFNSPADTAGKNTSVHGAK
jgi:RNA polymerase sigma-70 factor, ECF subfamily